MAKSNIAIGVDPGNVWKHSMLSGYQYQLEKQEQAEEKYKRAFERATMTTQYIQGDRITGGDKKDLYDKINDLEPLKVKVTDAIKEAVKIRAETIKMIDSVEPIKYRLLLNLLYLNGMGYKEAGNKMRLGRGEKIEVLHNKALKMVRCERVK
ncbi:DUF1492 domain-containing protein [Acetobacterium wieringae]|uniref:DUF1492 domain-containing protein n=1 Tax=Acetobacterium wieringae TaxID=52694 RepID=UPI001D5F6088|nr:DUF1492 domain-containing protein [Acetobacterium wieringae]VUZ27422.1 Uncharacterised protein [Acetobacterium wieringae]